MTLCEFAEYAILALCKCCRCGRKKVDGSEGSSTVIKVAPADEAVKDTEES